MCENGHTLMVSTGDHTNTVTAQTPCGRKHYRQYKELNTQQEEDKFNHYAQISVTEKTKLKKIEAEESKTKGVVTEA